MGTPRPGRLSRRLLLTGGLGAAGGAAATAMLTRNEAASPEVPATIEPFHGAHQAGIATRPQGHAAFIAFDVKKDVTAERFAAVLRILSHDAERLTQGIAALGDTEPHLAGTPARLTVTFGFGHELFDKLDIVDRRPKNFTKLPQFSVDRLEAEWSGGDLLLQICAEDITTVTHTTRMFIKDARSVMTVRWIQRGFQQTHPTIPTGATPRNVMGQLDGTSNPRPRESGFSEAVWRKDKESRLHNGSTLVIRRIRAETETWDAVDPVSKEMIIGRKLDSGAPLSGNKETDEPDFEAVDHLRLPVIAPNAHIRRARLSDGRRILRRAYNYDDTSADGTPDLGLVFACYQADIQTFIDIQRQLADADMLNNWVTPIGSAEFLIPPGCEPGGWIGETLLPGEQ